MFCFLHKGLKLVCGLWELSLQRARGRGRCMDDWKNKEAYFSIHSGETPAGGPDMESPTSPTVSLALRDLGSPRASWTILLSHSGQSNQDLVK